MVKKIMQVILTQDVNKLGKKGEVKNVADGYALNFLFPRKLAVAASEDKIKEVQAQAKKNSELASKDKEKIRELLKKLEGLELEIKGKVSDGGKLFAGVTENDIIKTLEEKGLKVDKKFIKLDKHIKDIGEHEVAVDLGENMTGKIKVKIISE